MFIHQLLTYLLTNLHFHGKQVEASAHIQINSWHKSLLNFSWCFDWKLLLCLETRKGLRATTRSSVCMCVCTYVCVCVCTCVCLCVGTCDGMGPSQHNCHFAPPLQVLHTGEAGSSDGRLLPGIYGKWQLPLNKAGVAGGKGGKTTEVPKTNERTHTHTADASLEFISSALPGNLVVNVLFILFFFFLEACRASEWKKDPPLIYFLCLG